MKETGHKFIRWLKRQFFKIKLFFAVRIRPWFRVRLLLLYPKLGAEQPKGFWHKGYWYFRVIIALVWAGVAGLGKMLYGVRPLALLIVTGLTFLFLYCFGHDIIRHILVFLTGDDIAKVVIPDVTWRAIGPQLFILMALPVLFALWYWRDHNVRADIDNKRKDTNLKDFQETQRRAAGAMEGEFSAEARQILQIAGLHQLRVFLRGDYGESFRRPAYEFLRARLAASAIDMGLDATIPWSDELKERLLREGPGPLQQAERQILAEDWRAILRTDFPLTGLQIPGVYFPKHIVLAGQDLTKVNFRGATLWEAHLEGANLWGAHLEGADLRRAHLEGADLEGAHLEGANLWGAHLEGADLWEAHLEGATLWRAQLEGANLRGAHLEGAALMGAHLEGADLWGAHLEGADLWEAHLEGADLGEAHLEGAILREAHLEGAILRGAHLEGAILRGAHLEGANLKGVSVDDTTDFTGASYDNETQFGTFDRVSKKWGKADEGRDKLRALGLRHVNEKKK